MIKDLMFTTYSLRTAIASLKNAHQGADHDNNLFGELVLRDLLKQAHELEHRLNEIVHTRRWAKEWAKEQVRDGKTDTVDPRPDTQRTTRKTYDPPPDAARRWNERGHDELFFDSYAEEGVDAAREKTPEPEAQRAPIPSSSAATEGDLDTMTQDLTPVTNSHRDTVASLKTALHNAVHNSGDLSDILVLRDLLQQAHELEKRLGEVHEAALQGRYQQPPTTL
jgi:hypothetical protein